MRVHYYDAKIDSFNSSLSLNFYAMPKLYVRIIGISLITFSDVITVSGKYAVASRSKFRASLSLSFDT